MSTVQQLALYRLCWTAHEDYCYLEVINQTVESSRCTETSLSIVSSVSHCAGHASTFTKYNSRQSVRLTVTSSVEIH